MIIRAINNWVTVRVSCSEYSGLEKEVNSQHIPSSASIYPVFPRPSSSHVSWIAQPTMPSSAVWVRYEGSVIMISAISGNLAIMECSIEMLWAHLSTFSPFFFPTWAAWSISFLGRFRSAWPLSYSILSDFLTASLPSSTSPSRPDNVSLIFSAPLPISYVPLSIPPLWPGLQMRHKLTRVCWCALKERKRNTGQQGASWKSPLPPALWILATTHTRKPLWAVALLGFLLVLKEFDSHSQTSCVSHTKELSGFLASLSGIHPCPSLCVLVFSEVFKRGTGTECVPRTSFKQKAVPSTVSLEGLLRLCHY